MTNVVDLVHDDVVHVELAALRHLKVQLGETGAEGVVTRAMEEVANRLSLIERCHGAGEREKLWKAAKGLIGIAEQVGLVGLASAASATAHCARGHDRVALAAVVARLVRVGDRALTAVWDLPETHAY